METIKRWGRNGDAVRQALELGELVHLEPASEELTDACVLFAIQSGRRSKWAEALPDPRQGPAIGMEVLGASHVAARVAGLESMRPSGDVLRSAAVWGALGDRVDVLAPEQGLSWRGTADDTRLSGDVRRQRLVPLAPHGALQAPLPGPPCEPHAPVKGRQRASRRAGTGAVDEGEAAARAPRGAATRIHWENDPVGPSRGQEARVGPGRRIPLGDTTPVAVPLATGP